jgi:hypothetical protein
LNTTEEDQSFDLSAQPEGSVIWDGINKRIVHQMQGTLPSGELAYYVLIPLVDDIAPLGLWDKAIPAPAHVLLSADWNNGWDIQLDAVGETFAIWAANPIVVRDQTGRELPIEQKGSFALCLLSEGVSSLHITRR